MGGVREGVRDGGLAGVRCLGGEASGFAGAGGSFSCAASGPRMGSLEVDCASEGASELESMRAVYTGDVMRASAPTGRLGYVVGMGRRRRDWGGVRVRGSRDDLRHGGRNTTGVKGARAASDAHPTLAEGTRRCSTRARYAQEDGRMEGGTLWTEGDGTIHPMLMIAYTW
jgi:hypothetical protein